MLVLVDHNNIKIVRSLCGKKEGVVVCVVAREGILSYHCVCKYTILRRPVAVTVIHKRFANQQDPTKIKIGSNLGA